MKKIIPLLVVLFLSASVSAQYKKASFFGKEGRTYEIGSQLYAMGGDKGNPIGFKVAFGRDQDGKRFFSSWELQFIPSFKYSYVTTDDGDAAVTVNGATKPYFLYALNYGFHVLKNDEEKRIVKPFVAAGLNIVLGGQSKSETFTPDNVYGLKKMTVQPAFAMGFSGGAGCLINITSKFGIRLQGGYTYQLNLDGSDHEDGIDTYHVFTSHMYVSAGLRLRIAAE